MAVAGDLTWRCLHPFTLDQYPRERSSPSGTLDGAGRGEGPRSVAELHPGANGRAATLTHAPTMPSAPRGLVDQYLRLAAVLQKAQVERGVRTVSVTSALPQAAKTMAAVNLARILSESCGRRVLLVDADLRNPTVHQVIRIANDVGLGDVLQSTTHGLPFIEVSPLLSVLTAGQSEASLTAPASERMRLLLDDCADRFDWLLLDSPPLGVPPDVPLLAHRSDAVLFVIDAESEPFPVVERALAALGRNCVIGTVLSGIPEYGV
jgi:succinoglycan biosynthesis transport protein ExoP